jgi:predicted DNA-binding transcriptional regulator AlpA
MWNPATVHIPADWRDRYVTVEQLAVLIGRTPRAIYNLNYRDEGPVPYRMGRRVLYYGHDVEAWIQRHSGKGGGK